MTTTPPTVSSSNAAPAARDLGLLTSVDLVALTGATYRQVDYWDRIGLIHAEHPATGSGSARLFTHAEAEIVRALAWLSAKGTSPNGEMAVGIVHALRQGQRGWTEVIPGVIIDLEFVGVLA